MHDEQHTGFPKLSAPPRRARSGAGYATLDQLAQVSESGLMKLHGMGPTAIAAGARSLISAASRSATEAGESRDGQADLFGDRLA